MARVQLCIRIAPDSHAVVRGPAHRLHDVAAMMQVSFRPIGLDRVPPPVAISFSHEGPIA